ncbi:helix-turn-helix domain-containing protein [Paenibacillus chibensis]|uniref:helix-turn-helix domain-containing protein n=1 Tax=Paenibacillus chibensis TaxID=59846 RepID=UPI000FDBB2F6|nr:helix-turn-helix transcriptional regulator [Paenibacillus chibensis]MEC0370003.1 helix-turn-helix transcriptional regulator [Paenibacillus chibensis]
MQEISLGRCCLGDILDDIEWSQQQLADNSGIDKSTISRFLSEDPKIKRKISLLHGIIITDAIYAKTGRYYHPRELYEGTKKSPLGHGADKS